MDLKNHLQVLCLHVLGQNMMVGDIAYEEWMVCLMRLVDVHNHRPSTCQHNYHVATTLDVVWPSFIGIQAIIVVHKEP